MAPESRNNEFKTESSPTVYYRPSKPYKLSSTRIKYVRKFIHEWKNWVTNCEGGKSPTVISSLIDDVIWKKLLKQHKQHVENKTKDEINEYFVKYFQDQVNLEDKLIEQQELKNMTSFKFSTPKNTSMMQALMNHINKARQYTQRTTNEDTKRRILLRCIKTLPKILNISKDEVHAGIINDLNGLEKIIKGCERTISHLLADGTERTLDSDDESVSSSNARDERSDCESGDGDNKTVMKCVTKQVKNSDKKDGSSTTELQARKASIGYDKVIGQEDFDEIIAWKVKFVQEEAEAAACGLCYGCNQVGHQREQCPVAELRQGMRKRMIGKCFNCGVPGHSYRDCIHPLKPNLEARLRRIEAKYGKKRVSLGYSRILRSDILFFFKT